MHRKLSLQGSCKLDDRVDVCGRLDHGGQVADVSAGEFFALLGGSHWGDVQQAQRLEAAM